MMKSKNAKHSSSSLRSTNVKANLELMLDITNIQGRQLNSVLSVSINNIRTVRQLKKAIATRHNLSVQELMYRGVCLGDDQQLALLLPTMMKIGNAPRFAVRTRLCTSPRLGDVSLFVKSLQGTSFQVHLPSQSTIADLENAIRLSEGYHSKQHFRLLCDGKLLSQENLLLPRSGSNVHVVGQLQGGWATHQPPQTFIDMENMSSLKTCKPFGHRNTTSPWRNVSLGLNIRGKCQNHKCKAYGCNVYCQKRFTVFNIAEPVTCPSCKEKFTAVTCGFRGCEWMFEGRKTMSGIDIMSSWNVTGVEEFQWFDDRGGRNTTDWSSLVITVKSLPVIGSELELVTRGSCVLCFGPSEPSRIRSGGACRHAVHAECAREYERAGYDNCPTCRLPLSLGRAGTFATPKALRRKIEFVWNNLQKTFVIKGIAVGVE